MIVFAKCSLHDDVDHQSEFSRYGTIELRYLLIHADFYPDKDVPGLPY